MALLLGLYLHLGSIGAGADDQADPDNENIVQENGDLILQEDGASTVLKQ